MDQFVNVLLALNKVHTVFQKARDWRLGLRHCAIGFETHF